MPVSKDHFWNAELRPCRNNYTTQFLFCKHNFAKYPNPLILLLAYIRITKRISGCIFKWLKVEGESLLLCMDKSQTEVVHKLHFISIVLQLLLTFPFSDLMTQGPSCRLHADHQDNCLDWQSCRLFWHPAEVRTLASLKLIFPS